MSALPAPVRADLDAVMADERQTQTDAFTRLMDETGRPVTWAYAAWDELRGALTSKSNRIRAIAAQLLCNLAKSDCERRLLIDLDALLAVTHDERFTTARHTLMHIWKVGANDARLRALLMARLDQRFNLAASERNTTLVRYDLLVGLKSLFDATDDAAVRTLAFDLIEREADAKYQKKYRTAWKA